MTSKTTVSHTLYFIARQADQAFSEAVKKQFGNDTERFDRPKSEYNADTKKAMDYYHDTAHYHIEFMAGRLSQNQAEEWIKTNR